MVALGEELTPSATFALFKKKNFPSVALRKKFIFLEKTLTHLPFFKKKLFPENGVISSK
jgi:hypothetical protein